jgi:hypothetical protein
MSAPDIPHWPRWSSASSATSRLAKARRPLIVSRVFAAGYCGICNPFQYSRSIMSHPNQHEARIVKPPAFVDADDDRGLRESLGIALGQIDHVLDESLEQVELATAGMAFETAVTEFPVQHAAPMGWSFSCSGGDESRVAAMMGVHLRLAVNP